MILYQVAKDLLDGTGCTHAEMVAQAASDVASGENEGIVLVSALPGGRGSLHKWKNSAESPSVSRKHAEQLRQVDARGLAEGGRLDPRYGFMPACLKT